MTPEEKSLLERTYAFAKENNDLLCSMRRRARIGTFLRIFYWVIIIGASFGAYYLIQPYIEFLKGVGGQVGSNVETVKDFSQSLTDLLK
ncbi:MAG TPA: hypothetical protein VJJ28_03120 [Candidatus Paceibacterota bacterium]